MDQIKPNYYMNNDGKDLFDLFEEGMLTEDQVRGFYLGNQIKYLVRYRKKNGLEDLKKQHTYSERLIEFEEKVLEKQRSLQGPKGQPGKGDI